MKSVQLASDGYALFSMLALAVAARDYNMVKPTMTTDKVLHITQGRHILQELCVNIFVPNDTRCDNEDGFIKILSGPNASGKSVYLKQVRVPNIVFYITSSIIFLYYEYKNLFFLLFEKNPFTKLITRERVHFSKLCWQLIL